MSQGRGRRLDRLERRRRRRPKVVCAWWHSERETGAEAIARRFPEGVPAGVTVLVVRWLRPGEKAASAGG